MYTESLLANPTKLHHLHKTHGSFCSPSPSLTGRYQPRSQISSPYPQDACIIPSNSASPLPPQSLESLRAKFNAINRDSQTTGAPVPFSGTTKENMHVLAVATPPAWRRHAKIPGGVDHSANIAHTTTSSAQTCTSATLIVDSSLPDGTYIVAGTNPVSNLDFHLSQIHYPPRTGHEPLASPSFTHISIPYTDSASTLVALIVRGRVRTTMSGVSLRKHYSIIPSSRRKPQRTYVFGPPQSPDKLREILNTQKAHDEISASLDQLEAKVVGDSVQELRIMEARWKMEEFPVGSYTRMKAREMREEREKRLRVAVGRAFGRGVGRGVIDWELVDAGLDWGMVDFGF